MPSVFPSGQEILKAVITTLAVAGILAIGGAVLGLLDASVPVWLLVLAALLVPLGFVAGRVAEAGESLEPYYVDHIGEVLETFQKAIAGEIPGVSFRAFIERGILVPARQWLMTSSNEDVRLSILIPDDAQRQFKMELEAGHSVEARQKFTLPIAGSFAGLAFTSGEMQWTNDVEADPRWSAHPRARPGREYGSLAAVPIRAGEDTVAVLNVLSTKKGAFLPSELMYIETLGSILNVAWSLATVDHGQDPPESADQTPG